MMAASFSTTILSSRGRAMKFTCVLAGGALRW